MRMDCPSAPAEAAGSHAFGVVGGTVEEPRVAYLRESIPVSAELLAASKPITPNEVLRTAAPCAEKQCAHFHADKCMLAASIVARLPIVVSRPPPCSLRSTCRWWRQEAVAACLRCPQVVTRSHSCSANYEEAVAPAR